MSFLLTVDLSGEAFSWSFKKTGEKFRQFLELENDEFQIFAYSQKKQWYDHFLNVHGSGQLDKILKGKIFLLSYGFIVFIWKKEKKLFIYSDVFGVYPLFYRQCGNNIQVSDEFKQLLIPGGQTFNLLSLLDFSLFHYILGRRTLFKEIQKFYAGDICQIMPGKFSVGRFIKIEELVLNGHDRNLHKKDNLSFFLLNEINDSINNDLPLSLTLTGGFDSRTLLAIMLHSGQTFSTVTFGARGNLQNILAAQLSQKLDLKHYDLFLDQSFLSKLEEYSEKTCKKTSFNPVLLDTPHYAMMEKTLSFSNIVTGFMGSELIRGASVSSQTTLTRFAANILKAKTVDEIRALVTREVKSTDFIYHCDNESLESYVQTLIPYSSTGLNHLKNLNVLHFLLCEKYPKYFGNLIYISTPKHNIIIPYVNLDFLKTIVNIKNGFSSIRPFETNAFYHYFFYKRYARIIKDTYPELLNIKVDRGYKAYDLLYFHRTPWLIFYYLLNHVFHYSKITTPKPLDYYIWLNRVFENINIKSFDYNPFLKSEIFSSFHDSLWNAIPIIKKQRMIMELGILLSVRL